MSKSIVDVWKPADQIPPEYKVETPYSLTHYLCDGKLIEWKGETTKITSPICSFVDGKWQPTFLGTTPVLGTPELTACLESAVKAYANGSGPWPTMPVEGRIKHMEAFLEEFIKNKAEIVKLLMWEICKNASDAGKEFDRTSEYIHDTIGELKELDRASSRFTIKEGIMAQIRRSPLGVALCMGPFNYPLNETFTTLIPALIMGNTIVFKPPKHGCLLFKKVIDCFQHSFPPGVVNTIFGSGSTIINPIISTGKIDVLAFIGTSRVADTIRKTHPKPHRLRCVLGLDAKNPAIICADADIDQAAKECLLGTLSFNGQRCTAIKIVFVHSSVAELFINKLSTLIASELCPGLPWEKSTAKGGGYCSITPLPERNKVGALQDLINDALGKGATIRNDHGGEHNETLFYPAVVFPVTSDMRLFHEEQFGPIIPVAQFNDLKTPIQFIADSKYGQQVALFGKSPDQMCRLIDPLVNQVSRVNVNCQCQRGPDSFPFTGRKDSAEGTLSVSDALRCFSIRAVVAAKQTEANKTLFQQILHDRKSSFLSTDFIF